MHVKIVDVNNGQPPKISRSRLKKWIFGRVMNDDRIPFKCYYKFIFYNSKIHKFRVIKCPSNSSDIAAANEHGLGEGRAAERRE